MADRIDLGPTVAKTTPPVTLRYPRLNEPDVHPEYHPEGVYKADFLMKAEDAQPLIDEITAMEELALERAKDAEKTPKGKKTWEIKNHPYEVEEDDDGEETGYVLFKVKMKASGVSKKTGKEWTRKPVIFDAGGNRLRKLPAIGGGSLAKVRMEMRPYATKLAGAGVSLSLEGVQILELREFGERSAAEMGFGVEDGYRGGGSYDDDDDDMRDSFDDEADSEAKDGETDF